MYVSITVILLCTDPSTLHRNKECQRCPWGKLQKEKFRRVWTKGSVRWIALISHKNTCGWCWGSFYTTTSRHFAFYLTKTSTNIFYAIFSSWNWYSSMYVHRLHCLYRSLAAMEKHLFGCLVFPLYTCTS